MICDFVHVTYIAWRVEGLEICNPAARNEIIRKLTKPRYRQGVQYSKQVADETHFRAMFSRKLEKKAACVL